jgi:hypothetical protein
MPNAISSVIPYVSSRENDVALDAASRDRALEIAGLAHEELRTDRTRRRAARGHDGGDGDPAPDLTPQSGPLQRLVHVGSI